MKLYDVGAGEKLTVVVKNGEGASLEYCVEVLFSKQQILFIEPIVANGKMVNFSGEGIKIEACYVPKNEMPFEWKGCTIKGIEYEGKKYHVIFTKFEGKHVNRRDTYRQYVGERGILQLGANRKAIDVTVRDISVTGISFVSLANYEKNELGRIHLNYIDEECKLQVQVYGKVVRKEAIDEYRTIYGCVVEDANLNIGKYIAIKQKKEAARKRA